jgi:hypothetical protein
LLSDFDTWHECLIHHTESQSHPENDEPQEVEGLGVECLEMLRNIYATFRANARRAGFAGNFRDACLLGLEVPPGVTPLPGDWIDSAEGLADFWGYQAREADAQAAGFTCALEQRLVEDGADEARNGGDF